MIAHRGMAIPMMTTINRSGPNTSASIIGTCFQDFFRIVDLRTLLHSPQPGRGQGLGGSQPKKRMEVVVRTAAQSIPGIELSVAVTTDCSYGYIQVPGGGG